MSSPKNRSATVSLPLIPLAIVTTLLGSLVIGLVAIRRPVQPTDVEASNKEMEQEGNNSVATATVTTNLGQKHVGTIAANDVDYWRVGLESGKWYQLQMVKDEDAASGKGKDETRFSLLKLNGSTEEVVVAPTQKNFTFSGAAGTYYVKVTSTTSVRYQFVIKDISSKQPAP